MNIQTIKEYSLYHNIYMNFKVDNGEIYGLVEGVAKQTSLVTPEQLDKYESFLNESIDHLTKYESFYGHEASKLLKKFNTYKKRLDSAKSKIHDSNLNLLNFIIKKVKTKGYTLSNGEVMYYDQKENTFMIDDEIISAGYAEEIIMSDLGLYKEVAI